MNAGNHDINQTLEFRTATAMARLLPTGLLLIFLGLSIFVLADADTRRIGTLTGVVVCVIAGSAVVAVALWRRFYSGKPLFTLSPDGIHYRIPWIRAINIPWSEILGVGTIDIETGYWSILDRRHLVSIPDYYEVTYPNVTVVDVSKQFYDARISVVSFLLRGQGWKASFIPKGELVQVALHHDLVSVEPRLLRDAVESRWLAFRGRPARTSVPGAGVTRGNADARNRTARKSDVVAMGPDPAAMSRRQAAINTALVIAIAAVLANLAGLWDLPGQNVVREAGAKKRAEQKYWADSVKRNREESKRLEAEQQELRRQLDEDMRRVFGR